MYWLTTEHFVVAKTPAQLLPQDIFSLLTKLGKSVIILVDLQREHLVTR